MILAAALLVLLVVLLILKSLMPQRPDNFPPGPTISDMREIIWAMTELSKGGISNILKHFRRKYGDIIGFVLPTGLNIIHVFNLQDIRDASALPQLAGRPDVFAFLVRNRRQRLGISFNEGRGWAEHRRFALRHLRKLTFGSSCLETMVVDEFERMFNDMLPKCGKSVDMRFHLDLASANVIWRVMASHRLDSSCPQTKITMGLIASAFHALGPQNPTNVAPWLRHVIPEWSGHAALVRYRDFFEILLGDLIQQHRQSLDPSTPRDFFDQFLVEMTSPEAESRHFTERNLLSIAMDFFEAAHTTTSVTLLWGILLLVLHPKVQTRVQHEIDLALGDQPPSYSDRMLLPYTEATLLEVSRRASVIPQAIPHKAITEVTFRGFTIPKDSIVLLHLWSVHMDPTYWGDPEAFRPERFLSADGTVRRDENVIPFGTGKRVCLGEMAARMTLFVMFTRLVQRFRFTAVPGQTLTLKTSFLVLRRPDDFLVNYTSRR